VNWTGRWEALSHSRPSCGLIYIIRSALATSSKPKQIFLLSTHDRLSNARSKFSSTPPAALKIAQSAHVIVQRSAHPTSIPTRNGGADAECSTAHSVRRARVSGDTLVSEKARRRKHASCWTEPWSPHQPRANRPCGSDVPATRSAANSMGLAEERGQRERDDGKSSGGAPIGHCKYCESVS
jgi:hypothetical protein